MKVSVSRMLKDFRLWAQLLLTIQSNPVSTFAPAESCCAAGRNSAGCAPPSIRHLCLPICSLFASAADSSRAPDDLLISSVLPAPNSPLGKVSMENKHHVGTKIKQIKGQIVQQQGEEFKRQVMRQVRGRNCLKGGWCTLALLWIWAGVEVTFKTFSGSSLLKAFHKGPALWIWGRQESGWSPRFQEATPNARYNAIFSAWCFTLPEKVFWDMLGARCPQGNGRARLGSAGRKPGKKSELHCLQEEEGYSKDRGQHKTG